MMNVSQRPLALSHPATLKRSYSSSSRGTEADVNSMVLLHNNQNDVLPPINKKRKINDTVSPLVQVAPTSFHSFVPSAIGAKRFMHMLQSNSNNNHVRLNKKQASVAFSQDLLRFDALQSSPNPRNMKSCLKQTIAFLSQQESFIHLDRDSKVTLAFHYTDEKQADKIQRRGFTETKKLGGTDFGNGIYLSTRPDGLCFRGDVGMVVAIVRGKAVRVGSGDSTDDTIDTVVGNKKMRNYRVRSVDTPVFLDETVVKKGTQCLPLLAFPAAIVQRDDMTDLGVCCEALQRLVDVHFNKK